ncbi:MAG: class D sortase [Thermoanaerobaculia bacterium]
MSEAQRPGAFRLVFRALRLEHLLFAIGGALLLLFGAVRLHSAVSSSLDVAAFAAARSVESDPVLTQPVDQSLWSAGRIVKYRASLGLATAPPLAVLRIAKLGIEVPVLPGTDDKTLDRAVGNIAGTARPGEAGNVGIAGHRDGFFRGLKDITTGDRIELETLTGKQEFEVTSIRVVDPSALEVLAPTPQPTLTLVTCYPFYFVGTAPQRYIVRAEAAPAVTELEVRQDR